MQSRYDRLGKRLLSSSSLIGPDGGMLTHEVACAESSSFRTGKVVGGA